MQGSDIIGSHRLLSAILDQAVAESISRRSSRWSARQWLKLTMAERYFVLLDMDHRAVLSQGLVKVTSNPLILRWRTEAAITVTQ